MHNNNNPKTYFQVIIMIQHDIISIIIVLSHGVHYKSIKLTATESSIDQKETECECSYHHERCTVLLPLAPV